MASGGWRGKRLKISLQTSPVTRETDFFSECFQLLTKAAARIANIRMVACDLGRPPSQSGRDGTKTLARVVRRPMQTSPPGALPADQVWAGSPFFIRKSVVTQAAAP
jgi:hypothetical protein